MTVASPCIKVCVMDGALCLGCGRTLDEIAGWGSMPDALRRVIMTGLPARLSSHAKDQADREAQADDQQKSAERALELPPRP